MSYIRIMCNCIYIYVCVCFSFWNNGKIWQTISMCTRQYHTYFQHFWAESRGLTHAVPSPAAENRRTTGRRHCRGSRLSVHKVVILGLRPWKKQWSKHRRPGGIWKENDPPTGICCDVFPPTGLGLFCFLLFFDCRTVLVRNHRMISKDDDFVLCQIIQALYLIYTEASKRRNPPVTLW